MQHCNICKKTHAVFFRIGYLTRNNAHLCQADVQKMSKLAGGQDGLSAAVGAGSRQRSRNFSGCQKGVKIGWLVGWLVVSKLVYFTPFRGRNPWFIMENLIKRMVYNGKLY